MAFFFSFFLNIHCLPFDSCIIMYIVIIKSRCIRVYHVQLFILEIQNCSRFTAASKLRYFGFPFHFPTIMIYIITEWYTRINLFQARLPDNFKRLMIPH